MAVLKRFEIWLFLAVVAAVIVFAFRGEVGEDGTPPDGTSPGRAEGDPSLARAGATPGMPDGDPASGPGQRQRESTGEFPEADSGPLRLDAWEVIASEGGRIVELTFSGRSGTGEEVVLGTGNLVVATAEGEEVPLFFAPFQPPAVLSPEEEQLVSVRYWLVGESDSLRVSYRGREFEADLSAGEL